MVDGEGHACISIECVVLCVEIVEGRARPGLLTSNSALAPRILGTNQPFRSFAHGLCAALSSSLR
jgi:hypothetical protein